MPNKIGDPLQRPFGVHTMLRRAGVIIAIVCVALLVYWRTSGALYFTSPILWIFIVLAILLEKLESIESKLEDLESKLEEVESEISSLDPTPWPEEEDIESL